jgi:hypothetical protein
MQQNSTLFFLNNNRQGTLALADCQRISVSIKRIDWQRQQQMQPKHNEQTFMTRATCCTLAIDPNCDVVASLRCCCRGSMTASSTAAQLLLLRQPMPQHNSLQAGIGCNQAAG